jgi:hypothetical protein
MLNRKEVNLNSINSRGWKPLELAPKSSRFFNDQIDVQKQALIKALMDEFLEE